MDAEDLGSCPMAALVTEPQFTQQLRKYLQKEGILDHRYRVQKLPDGTMALPVCKERLTAERVQQVEATIPAGITCAVTWIQNPVPSKASQIQLPIQKLHRELQQLLLSHGVTWSDKLAKDLPRSWQRHGDLVLLSEDCFGETIWTQLGQELWEVVARALGAQRIAKHGRVQSDTFRTPTVTLLLGQDGWVDHVDNGIRYTFDVTRCMMSPGNITEKLRIASLHCEGEVVVDLYAGIGYFTLPYLIHAGAAFVHACEWNPHAVEALQKTLELNGVQDQCLIHQGDNRKLELSNVADRVNLGLIPTSEEGWPVACQVLRKDKGGILHIHQNVESFSAKILDPLEQGGSQEPPLAQVVPGKEQKAACRDHSILPEPGKRSLTLATRREWQNWAEATRIKIRSLLQQLDGRQWRATILHIERVKSYAPHVDHLVLDLDCRPFAEFREKGNGRSQADQPHTEPAHPRSSWMSSEEDCD